MNYIQGDLIKAFKNNEIDVLVHGCNCFCTMGAGIALSIKNIYPIAYESDKQTIKGSKEKLGTLNIVQINDHQFIVNAYTQFKPGIYKEEVKLRYNAIENVMIQLKNSFSNKRIGLPKIGCGLAGLNWNKVEKIIENELDPFSNVTVYYL